MAIDMELVNNADAIHYTNTKCPAYQQARYRNK
jgi:hypothetical protein